MITLGLRSQDHREGEVSPDTVVSSLVRFQTDGEFLKPKSSSERSIFDPMLNHVVFFKCKIQSVLGV